MEKNTTVDQFIVKHTEWHSELTFLREIMNGTEMEETIKWGTPVYTINGKNVLGIGAFKTYVGIWFFQGVFLQDSKKVLINAQEGKTKGMRQWRFDSLEQIDAEVVLQYVNEAIDNQKLGKEIKPEKKPLLIPEELLSELNNNRLLAKQFEMLSLSSRREYAEYIDQAKREATKLSRLEKIKPMIMEGVGLNDKYK